MSSMTRRKQVSRQIISHNNVNKSAEQLFSFEKTLENILKTKAFVNL